MQYIKSPYNFVPLNDQVVTPEWAELISHDVPFREAQSGELIIRIEAKSAMFVRNGAAKSQNEENKVTEFSSFNGSYFIPGTSLKGMVRNVLEILSFSKMGNKVNNHRYAIRDLSGSIKDQYLSYFKPDRIYCGWLYKSGDRYFIEDCGMPGRIKHRHLDEVFGLDFSTFYTEDGNFKGNDDNHKSAKFKYEQRFVGQNRQVRVIEVGEDAGRKLFEIDNYEGQQTGTLVFTGQPGPRKIDKNDKWTGHHLEFVFLDQPRTSELSVNLKVIDNFLFAYFEHDKTRWSVDWKYWREKLFQNNEKIPVFFHRNDNNVTALGLSYLFKLPYENSVVEAMGGNHTNTDIDFSEAIFGYISEQKEFKALKGRVQFSHAFADGVVHLDVEKNEVLSSPKASYYPNYIRQDIGKNGKIFRYNTYMDNGARIAGWKRYPIHKGSAVVGNQPPLGSNDALLTTFTPIKAGAVFTGTIRYHNLHPIELGALISSLTFHGTPHAFHSLGMAKPLGYGKVTVNVEGVDNADQFMGLFEAYMEQKIKGWIACDQVKELITMAIEQQRNEGNAALAYMKLDQKGKNNDFTNAKKEKEALQVYSKLEGIQQYMLATKATPSHKETAKKAIEEYENLVLYYNSLRTSYEIELERFKNTLETKKRNWLDELTAQKYAVEQRMMESRRKERSEKAKNTGPDWDKINWGKANNAFDELKSLLKQYCSIYHADNNYDRLVKNHPEGVLPIEFRVELYERLTQLYTIQTPKDQEKWRSQNSPHLKKVKEWVGEIDVENLQQQWNNKI